METIEQMNPLFKRGQVGNSKDFIIFLLERLHIELQKSLKNIINNYQQLNQYDKNSSFIYFFNSFQREVSVISDIFFGITETTNVCVNCKNKCNGINIPISYNYQKLNWLIFPLEEVNIYKNNNNSIQNNNNQINQNNNIVNLYDCFYYNQKTDFCTGENQKYCFICRQLFDSFYTSKIYISPNVLIIILDKGIGNIYDIKIDFNETIDISEFVLIKDNPKMIYNLYGVITQIGQYGPNDYFIASCKNPIDKRWYRFNDSKINPISNIQKEVIEFGAPCALFYQKA